MDGLGEGLVDVAVEFAGWARFDDATEDAGLVDDVQEQVELERRAKQDVAHRRRVADVAGEKHDACFPRKIIAAVEQIDLAVEQNSVGGGLCRCTHEPRLGDRGGGRYRRRDRARTPRRQFGAAGRVFR